jgi:hypothetical protein
MTVEVMTITETLIIDPDLFCSCKIPIRICSIG